MYFNSIEFSVVSAKRKYCIRFTRVVNVLITIWRFNIYLFFFFQAVAKFKKRITKPGIMGYNKHSRPQRPRQEISRVLKYLIFFINFIFWVSTILYLWLFITEIIRKPRFFDAYQPFSDFSWSKKFTLQRTLDEQCTTIGRKIGWPNLFLNYNWGIITCLTCCTKFFRHKNYFDWTDDKKVFVLQFHCETVFSCEALYII